MRRFLLATFVFLASFLLTAKSLNDPADRLLGVWEPSNGRARVKIEKIGTKYYGKIVWLKEPTDPETGKPKLDKNNPDESLRNAPLKGYRMLKDFTYKGDDEWTEGTIYDPNNGSTYSCIIKMKDANTLEIRGYIGIATFGRTDVWKRLQVPAKP
ncbi:MAG: DUF2147 domain-containing protein [Bacteroidetes bacterium]|nr:DUF2147 domain-containing protein [Bacteroidota bacterium]MCK6610341.1 DUF2147 domain-containing protein [Bacteroidia bacterium]